MAARSARPFRDRRDRRAKQIHAAVAVGTVDCGDAAAKGLEGAARIARPSHQKAPMTNAFAAGKGIFRRRDQPYGVAQILGVRVAAGLAEDQPWVSPLRGEIAAAGQLCWRWNASLAQGRGDRRPNRVVRLGRAGIVVHRQRSDQGAGDHASARLHSGWSGPSWGLRR
jgi:hypothetical protein